MEIKTVRAILKRWGRVKTFCAARMREAEEYKTLISAARGLHEIQTNGMPRGNQKSDPTQNSAEEVIRLEEEYREVLMRIQTDIANELDFADGVSQMVNQLPYRHREIVERRYRMGDSTERIGYDMGYSVRSVQRFEREAIDILSIKFQVTMSRNKVAPR